MVYKTNESLIVIQAEAIRPNNTGVVFWSHDRGTAKLRMKLVRKNGIPQSLPEGTTVPIRLIFKSATAEDGYGKHDYLATIEDRVNGIVSIVLEDNILGYVGKVEGSVYIDFPNDRSLDTAGRFTFDIKRSSIDDSTPELEDYYFNGFSQTIDKIEKILADGKQEIEQKITESETQIDTKLKDTNDKITKANQDVATLNTNIDKANDRIDQTNQQIGDLGKLKKIYSNSIDFGDYDYSGNPNLALTKPDMFASGTGGEILYNNGEYSVTLNGTERLSKYNTSLGGTPLTEGKTYTLSAELFISEDYTGNLNNILLGYAFIDGGMSVLQTKKLPNYSEKGKWLKISGTSEVNFAGRTPKAFYFSWQTVYENPLPTGTLKIKNIKIEEGSTATPYQPNLLDDPYWVGKAPLGDNLVTNAQFPIKTSTNPISDFDILEKITIGETYTISLKGTKPADKEFKLYYGDAGNFQATLLPVEGLTDVWSATFKARNATGTSNLLRVALWQMPTTVTNGAVQIDWLKIEKGDTRTPNISQFKYFGEGLKDSNNPNDYSWNITPEYAEKSLNNTVSLTEPQSIEGLKNFEDGIQSKGKSVLTSDDMKTAVYTLTMSDVPDSTITELTGELVRVNNDVTLRCRVNAPAGTKVVFRVREGYRENIEDVWEIPLTAISQADHKNQVAYYALTEANKREIRLVTVTAGNHFITGSWRTDDSWSTL